MAGSLQNFTHEWSRITNDREVLDAIKGYKLPFKSIPIQAYKPRARILSANELEIMQVEIRKLLSKGVVKRVNSSKHQFLSSIFTVPKRDGSSRFILNLKALNEYLDCPHFKLEDYKTVSRLLFQGAWLAKLDLEDAYYMIPIYTGHQRFLRFEFDGCIYQFCCLPFGLCTAPRIFTKIMRPVVTVLRKRGYLSNLYLDDFLLLGRSFQNCNDNVNKTVDLLRGLGLRINFKKSQLVPSQSIEYLGFVYNSIQMTIALPERKCEHIQKEIASILKRHSCKIIEGAKLIGNLISASPAVEYSMIHTRFLERDKLQALLRCGSYEGNVNFSNDSLEELTWWSSQLHSSCKLIRDDIYSYEMESDSSLSGWGALTSSSETRGFWTEDEQRLHINILELRAAFKGLQSLLPKAQACQVLLRVDNTTALSYINRQGGCRSLGCLTEAKKIWKWAEQRKINLVCTYINTRDNKRADSLSRQVKYEYDLSLDSNSFNCICSKLYTPIIDLFASSMTRKCERYCSWFPDLDCEHVDAFTFTWPNRFYAFPPFSLVPRVLSKIRCDGVEGILVVPYWQAQAWYPLFYAMSINEPILFSPNDYKLYCPYSNRLHPLSRSLTLAVTVVSGRVWNFQKE